MSENHPAIDAVRAQKQKLYRLQHNSPILGDANDIERIRTVPIFKPAQVEKMLRVEVSREEMRHLLRSLEYQDRTAAAHLFGEREGPFTIEGVAYYEVASLPDPGWRVINPMEK